MKPFRPAEPGKTPSIVMYDPRYPHNVGAAIRAASCFGVEQVWLTGRRVAEQVWEAKRIPREERMKAYQDVRIILEDRPFEHFPKDVTPVAVELLPGSENLMTFEHPANPIYVFGPEDGSVPSTVRGLCHRRVFIPTAHCVNLAAAIYMVLYDRKMKQYLGGEIEALPLADELVENRGWGCNDHPEFEETR